MITKEDRKLILEYSREAIRIKIKNFLDSSLEIHEIEFILNYIEQEQTQKYASDMLEPEVPTVSNVLSQEPTNFMPLGSLNNPLEVGD